LEDDEVKLLIFNKFTITAASALPKQTKKTHSNSSEILNAKLAIGTVLGPEFIRIEVFPKHFGENYPQPYTQPYTQL